MAVGRVLADNILLGVPPGIAVHLHPDQLDSIAQVDSPMGGVSLAALNLLRAQAFSKYNTCMVYTDFLISGESLTLEGGQIPIVN